MNHRILRLAAVTAIAAASLASAAHAATATATATATQVTPIAISNTAGLNFGKFAKKDPTGAGTVVIAAAGTRSVTGDISGISTATGSAAGFTITGDGGAAFVITLPTSASVSDGGSPATTLTVDTFTSSIATTGNLPSGGSQTFTVGATLHVTAEADAAKSYTGSFNVVVEYN